MRTRLTILPENRMTRAHRSGRSTGPQRDRRSARERNADETHRSPDDCGGRGNLGEDKESKQDSEWWHDVGRDAELAGRHLRQRVGPCAERQRRRYRTEVDGPQRDPTVKRARASAPPEKCGPTPRMTMNALAHASTVTTIAASTRGVTAAALAVVAGGAGFVMSTR